MIAVNTFFVDDGLNNSVSTLKVLHCSAGLHLLFFVQSLPPQFDAS